MAAPFRAVAQQAPQGVPRIGVLDPAPSETAQAQKIGMVCY